MMIRYNYRYRGPYEYDKFILNTLQLYNEVDRLEDKLTTGSYGELQDSLKELDSVIDEIASSSCSLCKLLVLTEQLDV